MKKKQNTNNSIPPTKIDEIMKIIDGAAWRVNKSKLIADVFECSAIALSNRFDYVNREVREERYLQIIKGYLPREQNLIAEISGMVFALLISQVDNGYYKDYLGELFMRCNLGEKKAGQFFTPYEVSKLCAIISLGNSELEDEIITLNDPCCGSGGMIIAAIDVLNSRGVNYARNCFIDCSDIDERCVHMTYLQLSLTGTPAIIKHQDSLSRKLWSVWRTPAYLFQYPRFRKFENLN